MTDDGDVPPRDEDEDDRSEGEGERKHLFERAIPEILKRVVERAVETGVGKLAEGPENLRQFMGDLKLPKEVLNYLYTQMDDTKSGLYRVVAKELHDFFDRMQFGDELAKVLTKLSFEIKTEIRFVPNKDAATGSSSSSGEGKDEGGGTKPLPKPEISTQVTVNDRSKDARRDGRRREDT
jgi:hypothetical protein